MIKDKKIDQLTASNAVLKSMIRIPKYQLQLCNAENAKHGTNGTAMNGLSINENGG